MFPLSTNVYILVDIVSPWFPVYLSDRSIHRLDDSQLPALVHLLEPQRSRQHVPGLGLHVNLKETSLNQNNIFTMKGFFSEEKNGIRKRGSGQTGLSTLFIFFQDFASEFAKCNLGCEVTVCKLHIQKLCFQSVEAKTPANKM